MTALTIPDEEELYLLALMESGLDLAEFAWEDPESYDGLYRAWDFQWKWYNSEGTYQADQGARSLGKTVGITIDAFVFPFKYPGQKMLVTAPELNHLRPLVDEIEKRLRSNWLTDALLPAGKGKGFSRVPHWQCQFTNGAQIISRLPNKDGRGVKGNHCIVVHIDEAQDYSEYGWKEIVEVLNRGLPGARWHVHGVPTGVRNTFYDVTEGDKSIDDEDRQWTVHRPMAMQRPTWSEEERNDKIKIYGGSRQNIDYRRNIYGEHGDATHPVFILARLSACVDFDQGSLYNTDVYYSERIDFEYLNKGREVADFLDFPAMHKVGYEQWVTPDLDDGKKGPPKQVGAPKGYSAYYGGADIGLLNHPTEILLFGQRVGTDSLELLTRIQLNRIDTTDHVEVLDAIFRFYGEKLKAFGIDETGLGQGVFQDARRTWFKERIYGYNFSEKVPVGFEDRELKDKETLEDVAIMRNVVEHATDHLRNDLVDPGRLRIPFDGELLKEWQGQTYLRIKDDTDPYGKGRAKAYSKGKFHTLDAAKMMAAARTLPPIAAMLEDPPDEGPVIDIFMGAG